MVGLGTHKDRADRDRHEAMGFHDGWGTVADRLAALVEPDAAPGAGPRGAAASGAG